MGLAWWHIAVIQVTLEAKTDGLLLKDSLGRTYGDQFQKQAKCDG
jgi:hypothetical protein